MPVQPLAEMLRSLVSPLVGDPAREENAWRSHDRACEVGRRLPLVHRTCKPGAEARWLEVLDTRIFAASEPCTGDREKAAGIPRAAYFFLGCGAYPDGRVGFVLEPHSVRDPRRSRPSTAAPSRSTPSPPRPRRRGTMPRKIGSWRSTWGRDATSFHFRVPTSRPISAIPSPTFSVGSGASRISPHTMVSGARAATVEPGRSKCRRTKTWRLAPGARRSPRLLPHERR